MDKREQDKELKIELNKLKFILGSSIRYHEKRSAFFDRSETITNYLSLIFGSTSFLGLVADQKWLIAISAFIVAIASFLSITIRFSSKARKHDDFKKQYVELQKKLIVDKIDMQLIQQINKDILDIEAQEPAIMNTLNIIAHNEEVIATSSSKEYRNKVLVKVGWFKKLTKNLINFSADVDK